MAISGDAPIPDPPNPQQRRSLEMASFAASELVVSLRKAGRTDDVRKRKLCIRWARAIQKHLTELMTNESAGDDTWGPLADEERKFVFEDDSPREVLLSRVSDILKRSNVEDAEKIIRDVEMRLV